MNLQSTKNLPIISESVTIDITPATRYGGANDIAKITTSIRLAQPLTEDTRFILPNCNSIQAPKIYLPDGTKQLLGDFDPTVAEDINVLRDQINQSLSSFIDNPNDGNFKTLVEYETTYKEYKDATQVVVIPANQSYITFSYSRYIDRNESTDVHTLETTVPLSNFTLQNIPGAKADVIILMPFEIQNEDNIIAAKWMTPNGAEQPLNKSSQAGRIVLSQYWQYDPSVTVSYKY